MSVTTTQEVRPDGYESNPERAVRHELDALIGDAGEAADPIEEIGRLGARLIIQQALEDELTEFLGRGRYERRDAGRASQRVRAAADDRDDLGADGDRATAGRDASRLGFESRIVGKGIARTYALETLVICSFLRGLSVRDVEARWRRPSMSR